MNILSTHGRSALEVSFPSHQGKHGTCDFMTPTCAKECKIGKSIFSIHALQFFTENSIDVIAENIVSEYTSNNATCIAWFCESGDCPKVLTDKIVAIVIILSKLGMPQNGFTRNKEFWFRINTINNVNIALTIEDKKTAIELSKIGLVSVPNYKTWKVSIFVHDDIISCGAGTTCGTGVVEEDGYEQEEDCSLCQKTNRGCYTKEAA